MPAAATASATIRPAADPIVERWLAPLLDRLPALAVFDAHTHIGVDCDGTVCAPAQLEERLATLGVEARAATFALHLEDGRYSAENDAVLAACDRAGGRLVPFCRLNPHQDPVSEGRRAIAAGARGIKLHPRAEDFTLDHPAVREIVALADEHSLPVLIHAGRGIEPLGRDALELGRAHPSATLILAHAAITDLAWIPGELGEVPNVLFDTAWWNPVDLLALFALVPPGRIVFGSDIPFGDPALNAVLTIRCALQSGLDEAQIESVMSGQMERVLTGERPADHGRAPGSERPRRNLLLDRASTYLAAAWGSVMAGGSPEEPISLARMALDVQDADPDATICQEAADALAMPPVGPMGLGGLAIAATLIASPDV